MSVIEAAGLTHQYGRDKALSNVDLRIAAGSIYALLGPNGAGKTTLIQILMGLRRATEGRVSVLGKDVHQLTIEDKAKIGYVAEGQQLPGWMKLRELEAYLAPLYPTWDHSLATELRQRFRLDAARKIKTFSRGEAMKAALLCALAPRPQLLLMDEPFTGMDVVVKDELVRGLLEFAGRDGWTVLLCSHDIGEVEMLADWVGFLDRGDLLISEPMEVLLGRFRRVEVTAMDPLPLIDLPAEWLSIQRSRHHISFVVQQGEVAANAFELQRWFPASARIDVGAASLREIFVALAGLKEGEAATREPAR